MLDLEVVGRQLIDRASAYGHGASYKTEGKLHLYITVWVRSGEKKILTYNVLPAMLTNSGHQSHIKRIMWTRMEEAWDTYFKPCNKSNITILLCTN